ncbi:GntR family transcriptional regulator [Noviherbaspirillum sp. Root189]|uniref:GntR family transcriptional regulator n=1 Tax=Noviherbaspirillum sp. Root189 TaxID=1736487 RepID=UPI00070D80C1|nr:GntR family transcriptional regulator [Noviherbaspirillum sp. Root189]KRB67949.1 GntR family transcriptional regulator [Noviherbaspirillum sp. Root189]
MSPPLRKPDSLRSHVETFLREAIMNGRFKPGERLIERELCEMLEVSRPSLREALRKLEAEKLIKIVLHRGPVVASISMKEASDLYAIRALMESYAVHEFARLASAAAIERLGQTVQDLHTAAASRDRKELLTAKSKFYDVILGECGNDLIKEMLLNLLSRINLLRSTSFSRDDRLPESLKEIDHMFELIKARNAPAAREAAHQHILNAEKAALIVLGHQEAAVSAQP